MHTKPLVGLRIFLHWSLRDPGGTYNNTRYITYLNKIVNQPKTTPQGGFSYLAKIDLKKLGIALTIGELDTPAVR
jgi:hypothetical protein